MKKLFIAGVLALFCTVINAQTFRETAAAPLEKQGILASPSVQAGFQQVLDAMFTGNTNWYAVTYGLYAPGLDDKWGGGLGVFWPLNEYALIGTRLDYLDREFWMPSGNATLQLPLKVGKMAFTPFVYAGVGIPLDGADAVGDTSEDINQEPCAILGYGLALKIYASEKWGIGLVGDVETWTGFPERQYRLGAVINIKF